MQKCILSFPKFWWNILVRCLHFL